MVLRIVFSGSVGSGKSDDATGGQLNIHTAQYLFSFEFFGASSDG